MSSYATAPGDKGAIAGEYAKLCSDREGYLASARDCARMAKPWFLPPAGFSSGQRLPENYQNVGSRGITTLEGRMLTALYPVGTPWFAQNVAPEVRNDPQADLEKIQTFEQLLFLQDLTLHALPEAAAFNAEDPRLVGFRTSKRTSLCSTLMTGDSMERFNDDFTITVFRRDRYVVVRDTEGRLVMLIVQERKDALELTDKQLAECKLKKDEIEKASPPQRMYDLYTRVCWGPRSKKWEICQELNGVEFNKYEETITPFVDTPFELAPEEHYGRGFFEQNLGELSSLNECRKRVLDWVAIASRAHPVADYNALFKNTDWARANGEPLRARVMDGKVQDLAFLQTGKLNDIAFVSTDTEKREAKLEQAMLIVAARDSERTTAFEVQEVTIRELEGALGGFYAPIAEKNQVPTLRRLIHVAQKTNRIQTLPAGATNPQILTGITALTRLRQAQSLRAFIDDAAVFKDAGIARLNIGVVMAVQARYRNLYIPGMVKTDADLKRERDEAMAAQAKLLAAEQAISTTGNIVEKAAAAKAA